MGMNFAGAILKKDGLFKEEIEQSLRLELELIQDTSFEDDPFVVGGEEDDIAILTIGDCSAIWFNFDWLGYANIEKLIGLTESACLYYIGETAGAYHVEWFEKGEPDGTDDYEDGDQYHKKGTNRLKLEQGHLYFDGILPLIERWGGQCIHEDYPVKIYRTKDAQRRSTVDRNRGIQLEGDYSFFSTKEFDSALEEALGSTCSNPPGKILAIHQGLLQATDLEVPEFYKGMHLTAFGKSLQRRAMFSFLRELMAEWKTEPITNSERIAELRKILLHFARQPKPFPAFLKRIDEWQPSEVQRIQEKVINNVRMLSTLKGEELIHQFQLVYALMDSFYVKGGEFPSSTELSERSIAELKKDIYYPIYALRDISPKLSVIESRVYPALGELFRRGQDPIDLRQGTYNPDAEENQVQGKGSSSPVKIGGIFIGFLTVIYRIIRAMRG